MNAVHMRSLAANLEAAVKALREAADFQDKNTSLSSGVDLSACPSILGLSVRARKILARADLRTIGDLISATPNKLLS